MELKLNDYYLVEKLNKTNKKVSFLLNKKNNDENISNQIILHVFSSPHNFEIIEKLMNTEMDGKWENVHNNSPYYQY